MAEVAAERTETGASSRTKFLIGGLVILLAVVTLL